MASFRGIDLGVVTELDVLRIKDFGLVKSPGVTGSSPQNLQPEEGTITMRGMLVNPTQIQHESFEGLMDGEVGVLDLNTELANWYRWGKVKETAYRLSEEAPNIWEWTLRLGLVPCVGYIEGLHADAYITDVNYQRLSDTLDPHSGRHSLSYTNLYTFEFVYYLVNIDQATVNTLEYALGCGDDLTRVDIEGWKSGDWSAIGSWHSGGTAFGGTVAWSDEDAQSHTFRVNHDTRGDTVANFTEKCPLSWGTQRRIMLQISDMQTYPATGGVYNKYGQYQLLLKIKQTHNYRDALRQYARVTYEDGGYGVGPA